jgi:hypothetical protein
MNRKPAETAFGKFCREAGQTACCRQDNQPLLVVTIAQVLRTQNRRGLREPRLLGMNGLISGWKTRSLCSAQKRGRFL